ncbi:MarR family winged helix-turn-helix transcriptional regulator [Emticicia sp.]|uniref:MarR family winged helix-turn-helix transcriptional regulator n=1 Tax=Emticicia sp. TaxID=1930953 RepID=UPI0037503255
MDRISIRMQMAATLQIIGKLVTKSFQESDFDVTITQFVILNLLNSHENLTLTQQDLSLLMSKDKSAILRQIDELEKKNMVARVTDTEDRRKKILMLTKTGIEAVNQLLEIEGRILDYLIADVNEEELIIFSKVLSKIKNTAKE